MVYHRPSGRQSVASPRFQDSTGRIWVSGWFGTEPVDSFENGRFLPIKALPLGPVPWSIEGDNAGNVWISRGDGLFHLTEGASAERIAWATLGRQDPALALLPDPNGGGLWLGFFHGGVAYFKDGQVRRSYSAAAGLGDGRVEALQFERDGAVWAATEGGLSRIKDGRIATLSSRNGLPCDAVHWMLEDDEHSVWVYLACGLVRIARSELDAWARDPKRTVPTTIFDASDGVTSFALGTLFNPQVTKAADGRIWFVSGDGVSIIDPRHIPFNKLPPPESSPCSWLVTEEEALSTGTGFAIAASTVCAVSALRRPVKSSASPIEFAFAHLRVSGARSHLSLTYRRMLVWSIGVSTNLWEHEERTKGLEFAARTA